MIVVQSPYNYGPLNAIERTLAEAGGNTGKFVKGLHWGTAEITPRAPQNNPEFDNQWEGTPTPSPFIQGGSAGGVWLSVKGFSGPANPTGWSSAHVTDLVTGDVLVFPPADPEQYSVQKSSLSADGAYLAISYVRQRPLVSAGDAFFSVYAIASQQVVPSAPSSFYDASEDQGEGPPEHFFFSRSGGWLYAQQINEEEEWVTIVYDADDDFSVVETLEGRYWFATSDYAIRRDDGGSNNTYIVSTDGWVDTLTVEGPVTVLDVSLDGQFVTIVRTRETVEEHPTPAWLQVIHIPTGQIVFERDPHWVNETITPGVDTTLERQSISAVFSPDSEKLLITLGPITRSGFTGGVFVPTYIVGDGSTITVDVSTWAVNSVIPSDSVVGGYVDIDIEEVADNLPRPRMSVTTAGDIIFAEVSVEVDGAGQQWSAGSGATLTPVPVTGDAQQWSVGQGVTMSIAVEGSAYQWSVARGTLAPLTPVSGSSYQSSWGEGEVMQPVPVTGESHQWSVGSGTGEAIDSGDLIDSIAVSDTAEDRLAKRLVALLRVLDTPKPVSHTWDDFLDTLLATDNLSAAFTEALASALESTDATTEQRFVHAVDVAMAADTALSFYKAAAVAVVSLAAVDEAGIATLAELADAVETHEATRLRVGTLVTEIAQVLDVAPGTLRLFIDEASVAVVADEAAPLAALRVAIEEGLCPVVSYSFGGSAYVGYVMNTEGSNPVSTYKDFAFNSFTQFAGKHFVAGEGGLYQLGGDTDDGAAIEASFKTMMIDFGTSAMKRVQTAYLGYTASGRLILRVHAVTGGELREHWFEATHHTANAPRQQGRQLGRGLVSRYWQFELVNVDGADFHVHEIEFHPIALSRRV